MAFIAGLILQNAFLPSARTAAGWLLYLIPLIALVNLGVGVVLSYLGYCLCASHLRPWVYYSIGYSLWCGDFLGLLGHGISPDGYFTIYKHLLINNKNKYRIIYFKNLLILKNMTLAIYGKGSK